MEIKQITLNQLLLIGAGFGLVCGLVPLIFGFVKGSRRLGVIGFVVTLLVGVPFSLFGALPSALVFTLLVAFRKPKEQTAAPATDRDNF